MNSTQAAAMEIIDRIQTSSMGDEFPALVAHPPSHALHASMGSLVFVFEMVSLVRKL
jgi:hypothetical protein